jgi:ribosome-binding protein aMBF1 (putative translation factor)
LCVSLPESGDKAEHPFLKWRRQHRWSRERLAEALGIGCWMLRGFEFGNGEPTEMVWRMFEKLKKDTP